MHLLLGIAGIGVLGYVGYNYLQKKKQYESNIQTAIPALMQADEKTVVQALKLDPTIIDNLVKTYLSNSMQNIDTTAAMLEQHTYMMTGNAFRQRSSQLKSKK
jgi:hypothetical protein